MRRVVCAAIRGRSGEVLLGIRHYSEDMHRQMTFRVDAADFRRRHDEDQGFVDQFGVFMSRVEAYAVATAAGQAIDDTKCSRTFDGVMKLHSEGLY